MEETQKHLPIEAYRIGMDVYGEDDGGYAYGKIVSIRDNRISFSKIGNHPMNMGMLLTYHTSVEGCKPILRRMEDMTEDEKKEYHKTFCTDGVHVVLFASWKSYRWAKEHGFDTDGWIDAGLAVDEKTLNNE